MPFFIANPAIFLSYPKAWHVLGACPLSTWWKVCKIVFRQLAIRLIFRKRWASLDMTTITCLISVVRQLRRQHPEASFKNAPLSIVQLLIFSGSDHVSPSLTRGLICSK